MGTKLSPVGSSQSGGGSIGPTTPTDFTEGSVIFAGASALDENNTAFFWDDTNTQLKLTSGSATKTPFKIILAGSQTADALQVYANDGTTKRFAISGATPAISTPQINFGTANTGIFSNSSADMSFVFSDVKRVEWDFANNAQRFASDGQITWSNTGGNPSATNDVGLGRVATNVLKVTNSGSGAGALQWQEMTTPTAPSANNVILFAQDNGAGKTQLMALFATGAAQQVAIEP